MFNIKNGAHVFHSWRHHQVPFSRFLKIVLSFWKRIYTRSRSSKRKCLVVINCIANYSIALLCVKPKWPIAATRAFWLFLSEEKKIMATANCARSSKKNLLCDGKGEILIFKILEIYQWVFSALNLPRSHFLNVLRRAFVPIWRCLGNKGSSTATRLFSEDDRNCFDSRYAKPRPKRPFGNAICKTPFTSKLITRFHPIKMIDGLLSRQVTSKKQN